MHRLWKNTQKSVMIKHIDMSLVKHTDYLKSISKDGARCPKNWCEVFRTRYGTSRLGIKRFWHDDWNFNIPLAIAVSRPRAVRLPALTKSYRNLHFLPVAGWNPGKKTTVTWSIERSAAVNKKKKTSNDDQLSNFKSSVESCFPLSLLHT